MDNLSKCRENSAMNLVLRTVSGAAKLPNILFVHLHLKTKANSECGWNQFLLAVQLKSTRHSLLVLHPHTWVWDAAVRGWWQEAKHWQEPTCQCRQGEIGTDSILSLAREATYISPLPSPSQTQQSFNKALLHPDESRSRHCTCTHQDWKGHMTLLKWDAFFNQRTQRQLRSYFCHIWSTVFLHTTAMLGPAAWMIQASQNKAILGGICISHNAEGFLALSDGPLLHPHIRAGNLAYSLRPEASRVQGSRIRTVGQSWVHPAVRIWGILLGK